MKRVYCLYRELTEVRESKEKLDIPEQKIACAEYAEKKGWVIAKEFDSKTVTNLKSASECHDVIFELKDAALKKEFDILLVYTFDRLGRIYKEAPFVVEWFVEHGIEVWNCQEGKAEVEEYQKKLMQFVRYWQTSGTGNKTSE